MLKRVMFNLAIFSLSIIVAVIAGEGIARWFLHYQDKVLQERNRANILTQVDKDDLFMPIQLGSFTNHPDWLVHWWGFDIRTDSLGCRTGIAAPDNARTLLFLGDSMIFGLGLSDSSTIPVLVQTEINRQSPQTPCRVVNAGVIGYDFQQYLYNLKRLAPVLKPDLVLVGICYNDLLPNEDPFGNVLADRPGVQADALTRRHSVAADCKSPLSCLKAFFRSTALYQVWRMSGIPARLHSPGRTVTSPIKKAGMEHAPGQVEEFIATAGRLGVPLAFVYLPVYESLGKASEIVYVHLLTGAGQPVLDLSFSTRLVKDSYFLRESGGHLNPDIHFNEQGSRVVAEEISRWLLEKGLWNTGKSREQPGQGLSSFTQTILKN
jgi:lysophospholipase L1-like esterase